MPDQSANTAVVVPEPSSTMLEGRAASSRRHRSLPFRGCRLELIWLSRTKAAYATSSAGACRELNIRASSISIPRRTSVAFLATNIMTERTDMRDSHASNGDTLLGFQHSQIQKRLQNVIGAHGEMPRVLLEGLEQASGDLGTTVVGEP